MKKCITISVGTVLVLTCLAMVFLFSKPEITFEKAKLLYNSFVWHKVGQQSEFDSDTLLKSYGYTKINYHDQECFVFNVKDSNLKLYTFPMPDCNIPYLFQMVFVNEDLLSRSDVFGIGDSIDNVKENYSNITLFVNDHIYFEFDEQTDADENLNHEFSGKVKHYFEILNTAGLHSYGLNEDGEIIVKYKFDFNSMEWLI